MPLYIAVFLQGFLLWVPVEKLFMSEIGFDPASVGLMAAAYAAVVPIIEIPSGILADRWSRRGVLIISSAALGLCALIGGLSNNVATYIVSALILGVYFAMYSGTLDAVVYDTVLEETGDSDDFESRIGRSVSWKASRW
jgi:MFS family permease